MRIHDHLLKHGHKPFSPTPRMLRHWWSRLNAEVFDGELLAAQITYGGEVGEGFGSDVCDGVTFPLPGQRVRLHIAETQNIKAGFLATLAHEMIHQWQHQNDLSMTHGGVYKAWADRMKAETGITV